MGTVKSLCIQQNFVLRSLLQQESVDIVRVVKSLEQNFVKKELVIKGYHHIEKCVIS